MKVTQLRLLSGCYPLAMQQNFMANAHTKIERLATGDYLLTASGKIVCVPSARVDFAVCEADQPLQHSRVPVSELKKS